MKKPVNKGFLSIISIMIVFALLIGGIGVADMFGEPIVAVPALASGASPVTPTPSEPSSSSSSGSSSSSSSGRSSSSRPVSKKSNTITVKAKTVKVSGTNIQKKGRTIKRNKAFKITNAKGALKFTKKKGNKRIRITKKGVVKIKKGLNPGNYKVSVYVAAGGNSAYKSTVKTVTLKVKVSKITNPITVEGRKVYIKAEDLKEDKVIARKKALTIKQGRGKNTYKKESGDSGITVNTTTGDVTVKQGLAPGTYDVKISVTASGNSRYKKKTTTATTTIVVSEPNTSDTDNQDTGSDDNP